MISRAILTATYFLGTLSLYGQTEEFARYENDLMYPPATMVQLAGMVDSLNTKFATCTSFRSYHAMKQAMALRIELSGAVAATTDRRFSDDWTPADMERFGKLDTVLVVQTSRDDYRGDAVTDYTAVVLKDGDDTKLTFPAATTGDTDKLGGKWLRHYSPENEFGSAKFSALYFLSDLQSPELAQEYAEMVAYVDCVVDTTTAKLLPESDIYPLVYLPPNFRKLDRKEQLVLLDRMRRSHVVGTCSQDSRPRDHARNLSLLAAETAFWEVFLRAHLDIMNDRFERASDGSYAYGKRETYLKELEVLGLDIPDLLIGVALRLDDASPNHYYGTVRRLGRAATESARADEVFQRLLTMMGDPSLDTYNRMVAYFFAGNYCMHLPEGPLREEKMERWNAAVHTLPTYLHRQHRP